MSGLGQNMYKMNLEQIIVLESKNVLREWLEMTKWQKQNKQQKSPHPKELTEYGKFWVSEGIVIEWITTHWIK